MKRQTVMKIAAVPLILLIGVLGMKVLGSTEKETKKRDVTREARAVETRLLSFGEVTLEVKGNGVIESERVLETVSEATGLVTFAKNDLKEGTFVGRGEVVLGVDSHDVENDLYGMRSDFMNAVASLLPELRIDEAAIYRKWFDYFNSLDINKPVPELPEITNPQEKIKVSTRNIIGQYYTVKNQEYKLSKYVVRAPFDGFISGGGVIENSFVSVGQSLFTLNDARNLVVPVPLLVEEMNRIDYSAPPPVLISVDDGGETKAGRITRKDTNLDRNSQSLNVYVTFTNEDLNPYFLPGNYVNVSIEGRTLQDVTAIPRHLLDPEGYVYTMEKDGTLGRQLVDVALVQGDQAIIRNTIPEETVIVTTILQKPLVGMEIRSVNMPELTSSEEPAGDSAAMSAAAGGSG